nr:hypothetical protein [Streptomyces cinnamoneus]
MAAGEGGALLQQSGEQLGRHVQVGDRLPGDGGGEQRRVEHLVAAEDHRGDALEQAAQQLPGEATKATDFWTARTAPSVKGWSRHIHSSRLRTERRLIRTPLGFPVVPEV